MVSFFSPFLFLLLAFRVRYNGSSSGTRQSITAVAAASPTRRQKVVLQQIGPLARRQAAGRIISMNKVKDFAPTKIMLHFLLGACAFSVLSVNRLTIKANGSKASAEKKEEHSRALGVSRGCRSHQTHSMQSDSWPLACPSGTCPLVFAQETTSDCYNRK